MGTLSERGTMHPSRPTVIFWGVATGAVAAVMLLVGEDALTSLQTITIVAALPFVLVMVGLAVALMKDLRNDPLMVRKQYAEVAVEQAVITGVTEHGDDFVLAVDKDPNAWIVPGTSTPASRRGRSLTTRRRGPRGMRQSWSCQWRAVTRSRSGERRPTPSRISMQL